MFHSTTTSTTSYNEHSTLLIPPPSSFSPTASFVDSNATFPPFSYSSSFPAATTTYLQRSNSTLSLPPNHCISETLNPFSYLSSSPPLPAAAAMAIASSPSSSSCDILDFNIPGPVRRVYSTGDLHLDHQGMNGMQASNENYTQEAGTGSVITGRVWKYSAEERKERIERYRNKRNQRNFHKKITYACRKTLADSRPRVRGRFARNGETEAETEVMVATMNTAAMTGTNSFQSYNNHNISNTINSYNYHCNFNYNNGGIKDQDLWQQMHAVLSMEDEGETMGSCYADEFFANFGDVICSLD